jgi:hypothetical protein
MFSSFTIDLKLNYGEMSMYDSSLYSDGTQLNTYSATLQKSQETYYFLPFCHDKLRYKGITTVGYKNND